MRFNPWRTLLTAAIVAGLGGLLLWQLDRSTLSVDAVERAHAVFNLVEGLVWIGVAVALLLRLPKTGPRGKAPCAVAAGVFLLFGVSDFIEIRTGSWFQPWWLLVWNVACVAGIVGCLVWLWSVGRRPDP